jgi:hypothetical protein
MGDTYQYDSPRAGGKYVMSGSARAQIKSRSVEVKKKLTSWIVSQHLASFDWPIIDSRVLQSVELQRPLRISEKIKRFFQLLISENYTVGNDLDLFGDDSALWLEKLAAWTDSLPGNEVHGLLRLLRDENLLLLDSNETRLSPAGFQRLEELETGGAPTTQAFVAMWFADELMSAYEHGIAPAIRAAGYEPVRIDQKELAGKVDDAIIAEIRRSHFVVCDFTCGVHAFDGRKEAIARGGVYYEAGFAQGLGTPVIWTARADCIEFVHFDTRQFSHIVWSSPEDLRSKLYNRIAAVIGEGPGAKGLS